MTLRNKILAYLLLIHVVLGAVVVLALRGHRPWLLAAEGLFVLSLVVGFLMVRELFVPLDLIRTGAELIRERDFTSRFREVGQPEMDLLIGIYNRMIDQLREERLKLEQQHVLLDRILQASPSGMLALDFDGRVSLVNPAAERLVREPADRVLGRKLEELDSPTARELAGIEVGESRVLTLHGMRRARVQRVGFIDRGFGRSFLLVEELTEELRASEKAAYGKLIRMMSHEVNNSVGAVRSLLESCSNYRDQLAEEDRLDFDTALRVAIGRLESLNGFMNGFADVVRLPAPHRRACDLRQLLEDILQLFGPELDGRRIRHRLEVEGTVAPVELDKNQMEQALVNVLRNACESIGTDGTITVRLGGDAGRTFVRVEDSGGGVSEEARARLFTPFFTTKKDGRGIGLTVIQEILTRHGFECGLRDLGGRGAEFRIDF